MSNPRSELYKSQTEALPIFYGIMSDPRSELYLGSGDQSQTETLPSIVKNKLGRFACIVWNRHTLNSQAPYVNAIASLYFLNERFGELVYGRKRTGSSKHR